MSATAKKQPWFTGMVKSKKQKIFEKVAKKIKENDDWRNYEFDLEDNPEIINMQDADGRTLVSLAAQTGYADAMANLIENHKADVTIRDKTGKTPSDYFTAHIDGEVANIKSKTGRLYSPEEAKREIDELEDTRKYFMKIIKDAETLKSASLAEPLTRVSKTYGELTGDKKMDALALASQYVTGVKGVPTKTIAEAKTTLGRGRANRKTRKSKKTRRTRRV
jgi:hypothetical protein